VLLFYPRGFEANGILLKKVPLRELLFDERYKVSLRTFILERIGNEFSLK